MQAIRILETVKKDGELKMFGLPLKKVSLMKEPSSRSTHCYPDYSWDAYITT
jgi:hypothetical protein